VRVLPGSPHPLGATATDQGTQFALFSDAATRVELCLFDSPDASAPAASVDLRERTHGVWHALISDVRPGQLYGYRVHGPFDPERGLRCDPTKILVDPYAKAIAGRAPKALVPRLDFDWQGDRPPRTPWSHTLVYECHVKGMTMRHPAVAPTLRGTYLGLASAAVIEHLRALGVSAVELLPVHHRISEERLLARGLVNYWGYNTLGFFAPDARFATGERGEQVREFKAMVKALHEAGIEVLLDVVYNHTAEGDHTGPTLSWRGIDNAAYYHLKPERPSEYLDFSGCGNTLNLPHPRTLQLVMDSLRYWVSEMHVDGFRFDLAPALARGFDEGGRLDRFFAIVRQDPLLAGCKLIAEPWDLGQNGYRLGDFPDGWAEWNGKYRDSARRFWRGDPGRLGKLASRLSGSEDLYGRRTPHASLNFVTCHDGFTLRDLVSYEKKHNEANGEQNRDGSDANWSTNCGVEGDTTDSAVLALRARMQRNFLAMLAFSQGVPMLSHGDELGRTQRGNNNAYCQDGPLTWIDWQPDAAGRELLDFARRVFALRREHPVLRRRSFFSGHPVATGQEKDLAWLRPEGGEFAAADWQDPERRALGMLISGEAHDEVDEAGRAVEGDALLLLLNAGPDCYFRLPPMREPGRFELLLSTDGAKLRPEGDVRLPSRSLALFVHREAT
jgi:glycogen operon protein